VVEYMDWGWGSYHSPSLTGVNSAWHQLSDDDYDFESYSLELQEALYDAQAGSKQWLIELMCESVWPEDPEMAERLIDRNKIDEQVLAEALKASATYDASVVLATIFDQAYAA
jgi:dihydroxyacid dehydratase/phosphogluconate dehydratase